MSSTAQAALGEIHAARRRMVAAGSWPAHSVAMWRAMAAASAERFRAGFSPSPLQRRALDLFPELLEDEAA